MVWIQETTVLEVKQKQKGFTRRGGGRKGMGPGEGSANPSEGWTPSMPGEGQEIIIIIIIITCELMVLAVCQAQCMNHLVCSPNDR